MTPIRNLTGEEWKELEQDEEQAKAVEGLAAADEAEQVERQQHGTHFEREKQAMKQKMLNEARPMDEVEAILQRKYQLEGPYRKADAKKVAKAAMKKRRSEVGVDLYRAEVYKGSYLKKRGLVD